MNRAGRVEFGKNAFEHGCGGEFERTESGEVGCERCGARWTVSEWDEAQRHLTVLGLLLRPLYGPCWRVVARN